MLPLDEVYVVVWVCFFVDNHEAPEHLAVVHLADQDVHVTGEVPNDGSYQTLCMSHILTFYASHLIPNFSSLI